MTPQRLAIYQTLQGDTSHPTAEAVYARVRHVLPTVSLTTVYQTLNQLVAVGELKRFDVDGVTHFDPDTAPHAEAVCMDCHAIVDVQEKVPQKVDAVSGFEVLTSSLTFYGYCRQCSEERRASASASSRRLDDDAEGSRVGR